MSSELGSKINHLLQIMPLQTVATSKWLQKQGISQQLANHYVQSQWLERIGHGAFIRKGNPMNWEGALFAIQKQMNLPIHVGGKTALQWQNQAHHLSVGKESLVFLFAKPNVRMPHWFDEKHFEMKLRYVATKLFVDTNDDLGLSQINQGQFDLVVSSVERAIFEMLYFVPNEQSFDEAALLMEGQMTLRPKLVQKLLENCTSIKVKRLFMYLAEECNLPWVKKLDISKVNFGAGKRMILKGSPFDSKYKISAPKLIYIRTDLKSPKLGKSK